MAQGWSGWSAPYPFSSRRKNDKCSAQGCRFVQPLRRTTPGRRGFRRLARDYERLAETVAGFYFVVFAILMLVKAAPLLASS